MNYLFFGSGGCPLLAVIGARVVRLRALVFLLALLDVVADGGHLLGEGIFRRASFEPGPGAVILLVEEVVVV